MLVRVQRCADWPSTCGSWVSVSWSHETRSVIWVPTASIRIAGFGRSAGHRRVRHDDRDRRVARDVAVVEAERGRDRPRRHVVVHRHRVAVDRDRVARGVGAAVERDPAEHLARRAVAVQVLVRVHGDPVGGRHRAERRAPFDAAGPTRAAAAHPAEAERRVRRLPHRAETQHVPAQAARHREHRRDHRAAGPGKVAAAVGPRRMQPQRFLDRGDAAFAHAHAEQPPG